MEKSATFWMMEPLRKYATFSGRAPRAEYWWFYLLAMIVSVVTSVLARGLPLLSIVGSLVSLALLVPQIAVSFRRLHDVNRTGWWIGVPMLLIIPGAFLFGFVGLRGIQDGANTGMLAVLGIFAIALLAYSILMLVWFCTQGTAGTNRYGPDPLDPAGDVAEVFS